MPDGQDALEHAVDQRDGPRRPARVARSTSPWPRRAAGRCRRCRASDLARRGSSGRRTRRRAHARRPAASARARARSPDRRRRPSSPGTTTRTTGSADLGPGQIDRDRLGPCPPPRAVPAARRSARAAGVGHRPRGRSGRAAPRRPGAARPSAASGRRAGRGELLRRQVVACPGDVAGADLHRLQECFSRAGIGSRKGGRRCRSRDGPAGSSRSASTARKVGTARSLVTSNMRHGKAGGTESRDQPAAAPWLDAVAPRPPVRRAARPPAAAARGSPHRARSARTAHGASASSRRVAGTRGHCVQTGKQPAAGGCGSR